MKVMLVIALAFYSSPRRLVFEKRVMTLVGHCQSTVWRLA